MRPRRRGRSADSSDAPLLLGPVTPTPAPKEQRWARIGRASLPAAPLTMFIFVSGSAFLLPLANAPEPAMLCSRRAATTSPRILALRESNRPRLAAAVKHNSTLKQQRAGPAEPYVPSPPAAVAGTGPRHRGGGYCRLTGREQGRSSSCQRRGDSREPAPDRRSRAGRPGVSCAASHLPFSGDCGPAETCCRAGTCLRPHPRRF